jgi:hypothetical protein
VRNYALIVSDLERTLQKEGYDTENPVPKQPVFSELVDVLYLKTIPSIQMAGFDGKKR